MATAAETLTEQTTEINTADKPVESTPKAETTATEKPAVATVESRTRRTQNTQNRRPPDPRYLMMPMPADKKTNSRAGIRRPMHLCTRLSQEMYFRAFEKVSDANYFLERIYPGMCNSRAGADASIVKAGFEEITRLWKGLYDDTRNTFDVMIQSITERLEAEGVDTGNIQLDFSETIDEDALVTSRMDQHYLNMLQLVDKVSGFIAAASLYDVYSTDESAKLEREIRQRMLGLYRYNIRYRYETGMLLRTGKTGEMRRAERSQEQSEKAAKADHVEQPALPMTDQASSAASTDVSTSAESASSEA